VAAKSACTHGAWNRRDAVRLSFSFFLRFVSVCFRLGFRPTLARLEFFLAFCFSCLAFSSWGFCFIVENPTDQFLQKGGKYLSAICALACIANASNRKMRKEQGGYSNILLPIIVIIIGSCRLSWRCVGSPHSRCVVAGGVGTGVGVGDGVAGFVVDSNDAAAAAAAAAAAVGRIGCNLQDAASSYRVFRACL